MRLICRIKQCKRTSKESGIKTKIWIQRLGSSNRKPRIWVVSWILPMAQPLEGLNCFREGWLKYLSISLMWTRVCFWFDEMYSIWYGGSWNTRFHTTHECMNTDLPWSRLQIMTVLSVFCIESSHSCIYFGNIIPRTFWKKYGKEVLDSSMSISDMKSMPSNSTILRPARNIHN